MNASNPFVGRRFFGRFGSVCALWAMLGSPAFGEAPAKPSSPAGKSSAPAKQQAPPKTSGAPKSAAPAGAKPAATGGGESGSESKVNVSSFGTVDLAVQDTQLSTVLEMLAIHSQKNIIVNKNVSASVTAYLYDVTFNEALDAILRPNGYGYVEEGNFVYIYTLDELAEIEKKNRKTEARIFNLDHLSAEDAKDAITPLLSNDGKAAFRGAVAKGVEPKIADLGADDYAFNTKLVVNDYPENLERIAAALNDLDTPPDQVLVESTILQTVLDEKNAFGVDFSVLASVNFIDLTSPLAGVTNLLNGKDPTNGFQPTDNNAQIVQSTVGNTQGPGGLKVGVVSDDVSIFLRVLDEVTDSTVLARPKIMALNRQRAQVLVGAKVGYLSTTATETTTTQSVEFLDTGIKLVFRPFISKDGSIRMELAPSVSEASLRTVTDSNGLQVTIPDQLTNELKTNVRIRDGQTLVLGGLYKEQTRINRRQVPFLADVPVLGTPFRGQDDAVEKTEIIFLITPTVVREEVQAKAGKEAMELCETARIGMRAGLLPFSRELMTSNYNQDAVEALNRDDTKLAMWYVNTSLRLNPNQPEVIRLRERISDATPDKAHERSVLQRAWHPDMPLKTSGLGIGSDRGAMAAGSASEAPVSATGEGSAAITPHATTDPSDAAASGYATGYSTGLESDASRLTGPDAAAMSTTTDDAGVAAVIEVTDPSGATGFTTPGMTPGTVMTPSSTTGDQPTASGAATDSRTQAAATSAPDLFTAGASDAVMLSIQQRLAFEWLLSQMYVQWQLAHGLPPTDLSQVDPLCPPGHGFGSLEVVGAGGTEESTEK